MTQIIEIAFEITSQAEWDLLEERLDSTGIAYYIEPQRDKPFTSLEEVECQCEGK